MREVYVRGRPVPVRTHPMAPVGVDADVLVREMAEDAARWEQLRVTVHVNGFPVAIGLGDEPVRAAAAIATDFGISLDELVVELPAPAGRWRVVRWKGRP